MREKLPKLVVILGPTASSKSSWGLKLAKQFNGYIISADSRQIYREMNIGTNKPADGQWKFIKNKKIIHFDNIPHYMIDIVNPNDKFSVAQYQNTVKKIIKENLPKIPFLVGGTGLYIQAVVDNLKIPKIKADLKLRHRLEKKTNKQLLTRLKKLDPAIAKTIDAKNKRRLIRALEVCLTTGKPFSQMRQKGKPLYDVLQIGIKVPRPELNQRINQRVEQMIKADLVKEVKYLAKKFVGTGHALFLPYKKLPAFSGIGYQEIIQYLAGKISLARAVNLIKQHTHQYARRQMTWFQRDPRIHWVAQYQKAEKLVGQFLK